jgi:hypothetical protein
MYIILGPFMNAHDYKSGQDDYPVHSIDFSSSNMTSTWEEHGQCWMPTSTPDQGNNQACAPSMWPGVWSPLPLRPEIGPVESVSAGSSSGPGLIAGAVAPWDLSCMLAPVTTPGAAASLTTLTSGDTSPSAHSYSTPQTLLSSYSSVMSSPRLAAYNHAPFPVTAKDQSTHDAASQVYQPVNISQNVLPAATSEPVTTPTHTIAPLSLSENYPHSFIFNFLALPTNHVPSKVPPTLKPQSVLKSAPLRPAVPQVPRSRRRGPTQQQLGPPPPVRLEHTVGSSARRRPVGLQPGSLEQRVLSLTDMYVSVLHEHG